ncbi:hypothetical protein P692DRAFT_20850134 [Suillus brevipes Sb2]|nr:hypothetical protein P692DRAFT_20850134 [Suillus brevipes Sb2]
MQCSADASSHLWLQPVLFSLWLLFKHRLDLKVNCICAIQRNLSVEEGLVRTTRARITALHRRLIKVQHLANHCIPRITFSFHRYRSETRLELDSESETVSIETGMRNDFQRLSRPHTFPRRGK